LQRRSYAAGQIIVQAGQPRSHLFIVAEGLVEVLLANGAREEIAGRLGPGEHFGEYALFADTPYQATYRAGVDTQLLLLDEPKFDELVAGYEQMSHYVEQIGSGRLFATRRKLGLSAVLS
jgi:CRP-like cAMP-binding protein